MKWLKWTLIIGIALMASWFIFFRKEESKEPFDEKDGINMGKIRDKMRNKTLV